MGEFVEDALKQDKLPELSEYEVVAPTQNAEMTDANDDGSLTASSEEIGVTPEEASSEATLDESGNEKSDDAAATEEAAESNGELLTFHNQPNPVPIFFFLENK